MTTTPTTTPATVGTRALTDAALAYAERGWHVFPLSPGSKRPATPGHRAADCDGTDPRCRDGHTGWEQRATTDPRRITRAWNTRPYGIGIACGPSGLLVIDTDCPLDGQPGMITGETQLVEHAATRAPLPRTWTTSTPRGGRHRYFTNPGHLRNTAGLLATLIDTRGHGGYIVAPPTTTHTGTYTLIDHSDVADLPDWVTTRLPTPTHPPAPQVVPQAQASAPSSAYLRAAVSGEVAKVASARPGQRNHVLFCAAVALGQFVASDALTQDEAATRLHAAAEHHITAGAFTHAEAAATITSGFTTGARNPRHIQPTT